MSTAEVKQGHEKKARKAQSLLERNGPTKRIKKDAGQVSQSIVTETKVKESKSSKSKSKSESQSTLTEDCCELPPTSSQVKKSRVEVRKEQRETTLKRRMARPQAETIEKLRPLWEVIRQKSIKVSEKREHILKAIQLISGRVKELCVKADSSRIVQSVITYATPEERVALAREVTPIFKLASDEHGVHVLKKFITECGSCREILMEAVRGNVARLIRNKTACSFLDEFYHRSNTTLKMKLIAELYSSEFVTLDVGRNVLGMKDLLAKNNAKREVILENLRKLVPSLLNKQLMNYSICQRLVDDYLSIEIPSKLTGIAEQYLEHVEAMLKTSQGCNAIARLIAVASAKDRRALTKTFKPHVNLLCNSPSASIVLMALLSFVDDTVLLGKVIIQELCQNLGNLLQDKVGIRLVLLILGGPLDKHITPYSANLLRECAVYANSTSKKDPNTRRLELVEYLLPSLGEYINLEINSLIAKDFCIPLVVEYFNLIFTSANSETVIIGSLLNRIIENFDGMNNIVTNHSTDLFIRSLIKRNEGLAMLVFDKMEEAPATFGENLSQPLGFLYLVMLRFPKIHSILTTRINKVNIIESEAARALSKKLAEPPSSFPPQKFQND